MGTEATPSPLSALGNALHLPSLIQPPPQGTGARTANWDPQLGTERFGRTLTPLRTIAITGRHVGHHVGRMHARATSKVDPPFPGYYVHRSDWFFLILVEMLRHLDPGAILQGSQSNSAIEADRASE
jgi:hypothetical protein